MRTGELRQRELPHQPIQCHPIDAEPLCSFSPPPARCRERCTDMCLRRMVEELAEPGGLACCGTFIVEHEIFHLQHWAEREDTSALDGVLEFADIRKFRVAETSSTAITASSRRSR